MFEHPPAVLVQRFMYRVDRRDLAVLDSFTTVVHIEPVPQTEGVH